MSTAPASGAQGADVGTSSTRVQLAINYRWAPFEVKYAPAIDFRLATTYETLSFSDQSAAVRDISTFNFGPGVTLYVDFNPYARVFAGVDYRGILSASSELFTHHRVSPFSVHGVQLRAGIDGSLKWGIGYRVGLQLERLGGVFGAVTPDTDTLGFFHRILSVGASAIYRL